MFLALADVHKLCTMVFKLRNIFLIMNIGPEEHKNADERMPFSCSARFPSLQELQSTSPKSEEQLCYLSSTNTRPILLLVPNPSGLVGAAVS
jgi:hypothetical protein